MPYVIQTQDKPGAANVRAEARPAHLEYLTKHQNLLIVDTDSRRGREVHQRGSVHQGRPVPESDGDALAQGVLQQGAADLAQLHAGRPTEAQRLPAVRASEH
jgi:hypothetical protein